MSSATHARLLLGTRNPGKLREITSILNDIPVHLLSLRDVAEIPEPEESGSTYVENATRKASHYARATGLITLADDSGLEVRALNGAPGVHSARYAGEGASDEDRRKLLLRNINASSSGDRTARFVCAVAIASPDGVLFVTEGACRGLIGYEFRGSNGFGYDPLFVPDGFMETFAELSEATKNRISHRARALFSAKEFLIREFANIFS
jgi:XTP/dITP diphosphohydrolase